MVMITNDILLIDTLTPEHSEIYYLNLHLSTLLQEPLMLKPKSTGTANTSGSTENGTEGDNNDNIAENANADDNQEGEDEEDTGPDNHAND